MAKIKVFYRLDAAGRKTSLLQGGDGQQLQVITIEATPETLKPAVVTCSGLALIALTEIWPDEAKFWGFPEERFYSVRKTYEYDQWRHQIVEKVDNSPYSAPIDVTAEVLGLEAATAASKVQAEADMAASLARREQEAKILAEKQQVELETFLTGNLDAKVTVYANGDVQALGSTIGVGPTLKERLLAERARRIQAAEDAEAAKEAAREAAKAAKLAPVIAWVEAHGSERLRKALKAGLLPRSIGAYRTERLDVEAGTGWYWNDAGDDTEEVLNPSEAHLDRLLAEREVHPDWDIQLRALEPRKTYHDDEDGEGGCEQPWKRVLEASPPWAEGKIALFDLS